MKKVFLIICVVSLFASCDIFDEIFGTTAQTETGQNSGGNPPVITEKDEMRIANIRKRFAAIQDEFPGGLFITVPTTSPNYTIGKVKPEVLQSGIDRINLIRYIAGLPDDIVLDDAYTDLCQYGAVLMTANNGISHTPTKPEDMPQEFYDKGKNAASSSNISTASEPAGAVNGFVSDASSLETVGHRRWILNPQMKKTGFGVGKDKFVLQYAHDRSRIETVNYDYIAWPSPGVFPSFYVNGIWHITVNTIKYGRPDINIVRVTVKRTRDGRVWEIYKGVPITEASLFVDYGGYGINNAIIFSTVLEKFEIYQPGDDYQIKITGLNEDINYTVKLFDIFQ